MDFSDFWIVVPEIARLLAIPLLIVVIAVDRAIEMGKVPRIGEAVINGIVVLVPIGVLNHLLFRSDGVGGIAYSLVIVVALLTTLYVVA